MKPARFHIQLTASACLFASFSLITAVSEAQVDQTVISFDESYIEPFPQSSIFRQYTNPQPALATGTVNIPVELYTLNYRELTLPFKLQYHTQGIKVLDDSYPYGLGWTLTPGLRVTRTVMGRPDEQYPLLRLNNNLDKPCCDSLRHAIHEDTSGTPRQDYYDTQSDLFTVYLIDRQLPFLLKRAGSGFTVVSEQTTLRVETDQSLSHFTVTDDTGISYHFGAVKEHYTDIPRITTAWMVDTITLSNGEQITFDWDTSPHVSRRELSCGLLHDCFQTATYSYPLYETNGYIHSSDVLSLQSVTPTDAIAHLAGVTWPLGTINLIYRLPFPAAPRLDEFRVTNCNGDTVRRIRLTHSFIGAQQGYADRSMMFLESVDMGLDGAYTFEYNKTPITNKWARDWWGYYNGATSNESCIPQISVMYYDNIFQQIAGTGSMLAIGEASRDVDSLLMKANILTRINYPTGGYSRFYYEPHRWDTSTPCANQALGSLNVSTGVGGGLRVSRIDTSVGDGSTPQIVTYKYGIGENGLANVEAEPLPYTFLEWRNRYDVFDTGYDPRPYVYREGVLGATSSYMRNRPNVTPVWYSCVTEYRGGGKTVYSFGQRCHRNDISIEGQMECLNKLRTFASHGILKLGETVYAKVGDNYEKRLSRSYSYDLIEGPQLDQRENYCVRRQGVSYVPEQDEAPDVKYSAATDFLYNVYNVPFTYDERYSVIPCSVEMYYERLSGITDTTYTSNGNIIQELAYSYDNMGRMTHRTTTVGGAMMKTESLHYPDGTLSGSQQPLHSVLIECNRIGKPYKTSATHGGCTEEDSIAFATFTGHVLPWREVRTRGGATRVIREFDYDSNGNVASVKGIGSIEKQAFVWGMNHTYPVAAIAGLDRQDVVNVVGNTALSSIEHAAAASGTASLRSALGDSAAVMTFEYIPLVGMASQTDFSGVTRHASYDSAGRLVSESDAVGNATVRYAYRLASASLLRIDCNTDSLQEPVRVGDNVRFTLTGLEESTATTTWQEIDSLGQVSLLGTGGSLQHTFYSPGARTVRCIVSNPLIAVTDTVCREVCVIPERIGLTDINYISDTSASAHITCHNPVTVTLTLINDLTNPGDCTLAIDGAPLAIPLSGSNVVRSLNTGSHTVSVTLASSASGSVVLYVSWVVGNKGEQPDPEPKIDFSK